MPHSQGKAAHLLAAPVLVAQGLEERVHRDAAELGARALVRAHRGHVGAIVPGRDEELVQLAVRDGLALGGEYRRKRVRGLCVALEQHLVRDPQALAHVGDGGAALWQVCDEMKCCAAALWQERGKDATRWFIFYVGYCLLVSCGSNKASMWRDASSGPACGISEARMPADFLLVLCGNNKARMH